MKGRALSLYKKARRDINWEEYDGTKKILKVYIRLGVVIPAGIHTFKGTHHITHD